MRSPRRIVEETIEHERADPRPQCGGTRLERRDDVDASLLVFACRGIDKMCEAAALSHDPPDLAIHRQDWKAINALLEKIQPILDSLESVHIHSPFEQRREAANCVG